MSLESVKSAKRLSNFSSDRRNNFSSNRIAGNGSKSIFAQNTSFGNAAVCETGYVDMLSHSYGFINCREREGRLFFHFSELHNHPHQLQVGELVEFQTVMDRRSGRPSATNVIRLEEDTLDVEEVGHNILEGTIVTVAGNDISCKQIQKQGLKLDSATSNGDEPLVMGRISYVMSGECFYLPYNECDISDDSKLKVGDTVAFQVCTTSLTFRSWAVGVHLVHRKPYRLNGFITSLKENYGFIERSDQVKEIFFHFSELPDNKIDVDIGQEVEYSVQTCRNGKETATELQFLPKGSVVLFDLTSECYSGVVLRNHDMSNRNLTCVKNNDQLSGRVSVTYDSGICVQLPFASRDQCGAYTLHPGDIVRLRVATDRRDQLQRATEITLLIEETMAISKEIREKGLIVSLRSKEGYGFIMSPGRKGQLFFHFSELFDQEHPLAVSDKVEYTPVTDPSTGDQGKEMAIRVRVLSPSAADFSLLHTEVQLGVIQQEAVSLSTSINDTETKDNDDVPLIADNIGIILFQGSNMKEAICYELKDVLKMSNVPCKHDKVEFRILECRITGTKVAVDIRVVNAEGSKNCSSGTDAGVSVNRGWIIALKDGYGFLETVDHSRDIYFNFAAVVNSDRNQLDLLSPVEFILRRHRDTDSVRNRSSLIDSNKVYADEVRLLSRDVLPSLEAGMDAPLELGTVFRLARQSTDQIGEYHGLIAAISDGPNPGALIPYTIVSLRDPRAPLQVGDPVNYRVTCCGRAVEVELTRKPEIARVEIFREGSQFGFLDFPNETGRQLFFHVSEVESGVQLEVGNWVSFFVTQHPKSGKLAAVLLHRLENPPSQSTNSLFKERVSASRTGDQSFGARPARLHLKSECDNSRGAPRVELIRQPRGPNGTIGFAAFDNVGSSANSDSLDNRT